MNQGTLLQLRIISICLLALTACGPLSEGRRAKFYSLEETTTFTTYTTVTTVTSASFSSCWIAITRDGSFTTAFDGGISACPAAPTSNSGRKKRSLTVKTNEEIQPSKVLVLRVGTYNSNTTKIQ